MNALELYTRIGQLLASVPEIDSGEELSREHLIWLAQGLALVEAEGNPHDVARFRVMQRNIQSPIIDRRSPLASIVQVLANSMARIELLLPVQARGAFVSVGNTFDALLAIGKVLRQATSDVLIVDAYADQTVFEFAQYVVDGVSCRVLRDAARLRYEDGIKTATLRWNAQYGGLRPAEVRSAPEFTLHDRLILIDGSEAFILTQSLKDLAQRSPASLVKADATLAPEKIAAYEAIWARSEPLASVA